MKLFDKEAPNRFVCAVVPKAAREGVAPTYVAIQANDIESALNQIDTKQQRHAYPYVMGRYDDRGCYMVYKPPIDGVTPGRFVLHPLAEAEMAQAGWH